MDMTDFVALAAACAPLVHPVTAQALVQVESAFNPHAIGVVGGSLERQPRSQGEALATAQALRARRIDFSIGLAQINERNLQRVGLTLKGAFEPCSNLKAMETILLDCFERAARREHDPQRALRQAFSCYYSGNFTVGFQAGYVTRVIRALPSSATRPATSLHNQEIL